MTNVSSAARPLAIIVLLACASAAVASGRDLGFSIGYAQLSVDDEALDDLDGQSGLRFELRGTWAPRDSLPQLRLGLGIGFSFFYDDQDSGQTIGGFADIEDFEQISFIVPEFQATWRQPLGDEWFVEGGVGLGAVIGNFRAGQVIFDDLFDEDVNDWDLGLGVRPLVRGGYGRNRWRAGLEASYLFTDVDFGDGLGGNLEELYIGLFYSHTF